MLGVGRAKKKEEAPEVHGRVTGVEMDVLVLVLAKFGKPKKKQNILGSKKVGKEIRGYLVILDFLWLK